MHLSNLNFDQCLLSEVLKLYAALDSYRVFLEAIGMLLALGFLGLKLALVTMGNTRIQGSKIRLLRVAKYFDAVVHARETISAKDKPNPEVSLKRLDV
jgi:FMN phosphatase YigB (HAD superfamily)